MILIGQYDSPFVRRVAVALRIYRMPYQHRPWSTFGDADQIAAYNPLRRVPTLVLDDGEVLVESTAMLDHLDEVAGPTRRLIAAEGAARRAGLRTCGLATGLSDKMVSLVYERLLHETTSTAWVARCQTQIGGVLDALEAERAQQAPYWFGAQPGHADIAVACAMRFLAEAHPDIAGLSRWPCLSDHAGRCEAMDVFAIVTQEFIPPKR